MCSRRRASELEAEAWLQTQCAYGQQQRCRRSDPRRYQPSPRQVAPEVLGAWIVRFPTTRDRAVVFCRTAAIACSYSIALGALCVVPHGQPVAAATSPRQRRSSIFALSLSFISHSPVHSPPHRVAGGLCTTPKADVGAEWDLDTGQRL